MSWEEQMAAKAKARRDARIEDEFGYLKVDEPWRFDINHPKHAGICRDCCEWRLANPSAPWFGSYWFTICSKWPEDCRFDHDHHDGDVYLAQPVPLIAV